LEMGIPFTHVVTTDSTAHDGLHRRSKERIGPNGHVSHACQHSGGATCDGH
jgi:hypothetical protein